MAPHTSVKKVSLESPQVIQENTFIKILKDVGMVPVFPKTTKPNCKINSDKGRHGDKQPEKFIQCICTPCSR